LKVPGRRRSVVCSYCGNSLVVDRDDELMAERLRIAELENELLRLERDWVAWRERNLSRAENGALIEPVEPASKLQCVGGALSGGVIVVVVGATIWSGVTVALVVWGLVGALLMYAVARFSAGHAEACFRSREVYMVARMGLEAQIVELRSNPERYDGERPSS
jgi:hypothetical protein